MNRTWNKNSKDLEAEIGGLRRKLACQEEEFRLQQQTMRDELQEVTVNV